VLPFALAKYTGGPSTRLVESPTGKGAEEPGRSGSLCSCELEQSCVVVHVGGLECGNVSVVLIPRR